MDIWKSRGGKSQRRERQKKELKQVEKSHNTVFPMFCGSGGSKSRLGKGKAAGAEPSGEMRCSLSSHFWKLKRSKSARRCGAKHMSKAKHTKHTMFGAIVEAEMFKPCTALWR